jgi:hypothetical protein
MNINLTNYKIILGDKGYILNYGDYITFDIHNIKYEYIVRKTHLTGISIGSDIIFDKLYIDKYDFCERYYKYKPNPGVFPECIYNDYEALTRLSVALFNMCAIKCNLSSIDESKHKPPKKEFIVEDDISEHPINKNNLNLISNGKTIKIKGNPSCISRGKQKRRSGICCKAVTATIRVGHFSNRKIDYGEEEDEE